MVRRIRSLLLTGLMVTGLTAGAIPAQGQSTVFVDASAVGAGDGSSWADACTSVQAGLDASASGDQVWVAAGTYVENITLVHGVALYGGFAGDEDPETFDVADRDIAGHETILDGNQAGSVVTGPVWTPPADDRTRIDGFTITNGSGTLRNGEYHGGGIYNSAFPLTIANNTIRGNNAQNGGGVYIDNASPVLLNNIIKENTADNGGGVYSEWASSLLVGNTISGNSADDNGAGLLLTAYDRSELWGGTIIANIAGEAGGAIHLLQAQSTILRNVLVVGNVARYGAGINAYYSDVTISNATIVANTSGSNGSGVHVAYSTTTITNTIVAFNASGISHSGSSGWLDARHNCVYGNERYDYSGVSDPTGTQGNIAMDPGFADKVRGDFHLQLGSPCIDAGDNTVAGGNDMDGELRVYPIGGLVDIGADEWDGTDWTIVPVIRVSLHGNDANDGSSWTLAKRTVQGAIDAAGIGTEVWVGEGAYYERIVLRVGVHVFGGFAGDETELNSRDYVRHETILDGQYSGSVVTGLAIPAGHSTLDGFTITHGTGSLSCTSSQGGGVYLWNASPLLAHNHITENSVSCNGGGLYLKDSSPTIVECTISENSAAYFGAGLYANSSSPIVTRNKVVGNKAGGGLYFAGRDSQPSISQNIIIQNSSDSIAGVSLRQTNSILANNIIADNSGGGVSVGYGNATIVNNTIVRNYTSGRGALDLFGAASKVVANIVAYNSTGASSSSGTPLWRNNCVYGNEKFDYAGMPDATGTNGNISVDPRLAAPRYGNWHLLPDSPCVNGGTNGYAVGMDIDGQPRILPVDGVADIGADEFDGTMWPPPNIIRVSPTGDDGNDGSSWTLAKRTVQAAIDAAAAEGGDVWVQAGIYDECIALAPYAHVLGGFAGNETALENRDWTSNRTILDGQWQGSVVTAEYMVPYLSTIDGFTITHGSAPEGGGVHLDHAAPTVANNLITSNGAIVGGGIYARDCQALIVRNTLARNNADRGGALYADSTSATIEDNTIRENTAAIDGGGIYATFGWPLILRNTLANNRADRGGGLYADSGPLLIEDNIFRENIAAIEGGGMYCIVAKPVVTGNRIAGNTAMDGGGIYLTHSDATISGNRIATNIAEHGGGLYVSASSLASTMMQENTVAGNHATMGGGMYANSYSLSTNSPCTLVNNVFKGNGAKYGGGLYFNESAHVEIINNTIVGNDGDSGGAMLAFSSYLDVSNTIIASNRTGVKDESGGATTLHHCCLYGNGQYQALVALDPANDPSNIFNDPRLADAAYGNVHIQPDSPCVDAGTSGFASGRDMDGELRIQPAGGTVDIGADESDGTIWAEGPYLVVRIKPDGNDDNDGASWAGAKRTVQAGLDLATEFGGEVWVAAGTYGEPLMLHPYAYLYGGFAGSEAEREERDWHAYVSVLDGEAQGSAVSAVGGYEVSTLDGFTITNGFAEKGGGLHISGASPAIQNNTIRANTGGLGGGIYLESTASPIRYNTVVDNYADMDGGGVYAEYDSATFEHNAVQGNEAVRNGGGIHLQNCTGLTVADSQILDNRAAYGGGMRLLYSSPAMMRNVLSGNHATQLGGGAHLVLSSPRITNSILSANRAAVSGGGLYLQVSSPLIDNATIVANAAGDGGGIYVNRSNPEIRNTILAFNASGIFADASSMALPMAYNCVFANSQYNFAGMSDPTGTWGNIAVNPRFVASPDIGADGLWATEDDAPGDLRLISSSPCIDVGSNGNVSGDVDLAGTPRILDGDRDGVAVVDMGSFEYLAGDLDGDGDVDLDDYLLLVQAFSGPGGALSPGLVLADLDGDLDADLKDFWIFQATGHAAP